jgi:hypothetical protein
MNERDLGPGWVPFDLVAEGGETLLEWRFVGDAPFHDPWFEQSVYRHGPARNGGVRPRRTAIEALDCPPPTDALPLAGMIFHASRTGSTLVTQLLSRSPRLSVLSEPPIVEALIDWSHSRPSVARVPLARRLSAALAFLGRWRHEPEQKLILKAESQHILELSLFQRSFPNVPWVFLFREPEAILRSQRRQRGRQMVPGMIAAERLGVTAAAIDPARLDGYAELVLERTFRAALGPLEAGQGHLFHYRALPGCVWTELDALFGLELTEAEIHVMREHSRYDAKHPGELFAPDSGARELPPVPSLSGSPSAPLAELYRRLSELELESALTPRI